MKKTVLYILLDLVFLVLFNTVFFLVGGISHPASVWVSYGFIHFAYVMVLATPLLAKNGSNAFLFGATLRSISDVYFFVEFIVGVLFILVGAEHFKAALLTQLIIAGIYVLFLLTNMIANENTAEQVARQEEEVAYLKTAAARVKLLLRQLPDQKANKEIEKTYDLLHASPSGSAAAVQNIEMSVLDEIERLERAVREGDATAAVVLSQKIRARMEERNSILKATKQ